MSLSYDDITLTSGSSNKSRVVALETTLQQSLVYFKELLIDIEELHAKLEDYKSQIFIQKDKCDNQNCHSSNVLKKVIECKDNIIQLVASSLTKLSETKDLTIVNDIFKILFGDTTILSEEDCKTHNLVTSDCDKKCKISPKEQVIEPKIEKQCSIDMSITEDVSFDESVSEIEGTPTGRTSPIIQSRRLRSSNLANSSDFRDKKKCPDSWPTPENKSFKLTYPTPTKSKGNGRMRQSKINLVKVTRSSVVDLTSSPEFAGGLRECRTKTRVQPLVKKESVESDDTILPSPTSGPVNFTLLKSKLMDSPCKFKKPSLCLKSKTDKEIKVEPSHIANEEDVTNVEESENSLILDPLRQKPHTTPKKKSPFKSESTDDDDLPCDNNASISLLKQLNMIEGTAVIAVKACSPQKRPLEENINIANVPMDTEFEASMSLLRPDFKINNKTDNDLIRDNENAKCDNKNAKTYNCSAKLDNDNAKRKTPELVEPVYKEPTVRTKAEKRALKGWSCEECKNFFGELYKNDPVMLAKKIEECSKHRGRNNPIRPKTPPGFWNPRWHVPDDTEEFNRMNNA